MPSVKTAIAMGPLNPVERKVYQVISSHPKQIFSTTLEDLSELARWCVDPSAANPPEIAQQVSDDLADGSKEPLNINSNVVVRINGQQGEELVETKTFRTIALALASLSDTNRIWKGKLYYGSKNQGTAKKGSIGKGRTQKEPTDKDVGRIYYGPKGVESLISAELHDTSPEDRAATGFLSLYEKEDKSKPRAKVKNGVREF